MLVNVQSVKVLKIPNVYRHQDFLVPIQLEVQAYSLTLFPHTSDPTCCANGPHLNSTPDCVHKRQSCETGKGWKEYLEWYIESKP